MRCSACGQSVEIGDMVDDAADSTSGCACSIPNSWTGTLAIGLIYCRSLHILLLVEVFEACGMRPAGHLFTCMNFYIWNPVLTRVYNHTLNDLRSEAISWKVAVCKRVCTYHFLAEYCLETTVWTWVWRHLPVSFVAWGGQLRGTCMYLGLSPVCT